MIIYKITNKINKKVYIGQTRNNFKKRYYGGGEGIERVFNYHNSNKEKGVYYNIHLLNSIEKYGFDSFEVDEVFERCNSIEELNNKEIYWIKYYKSNNCKYGYNETIGGEGRKFDNILKFKNRINKSHRHNSYIMCLINKFREDKNGINDGLHINDYDASIIRHYAWIEDKEPKRCKYCNYIYKRKGDKNNLCEFCNSLSKEERKQVKQIKKFFD